MKNHLVRTGVAAFTLAILSLTTVAPAVEAGGRGKGRRWKGEYSSCEAPRHYSRHARSRVVHRRSSDAGPLLAGLIGGIAIGAAISNRDGYTKERYYGRDYDYDRDCDREYSRGYKRGYRHGSRYAYYDTHCDRRFASLDACGSHMRSCDGPKVVQVVNVESGRCVDHARYASGRWQEWDGEWDDD